MLFLADAARGQLHEVWIHSRACLAQTTINHVVCEGVLEAWHLW